MARTTVRRETASFSAAVFSPNRVSSCCVDISHGFNASESPDKPGTPLYAMTGQLFARASCDIHNVPPLSFIEEKLLNVGLDFLNPPPAPLSVSQADHDLSVTLTTLERLGRPRRRRSRTSISPRARAWRWAFWTVVRLTPASAAIASIGRLQAPPRWHWRPMTARTATSPWVKPAAGDLRRNDPGRGLASTSLKAGLSIRRARRPTAGAGGLCRRGGRGGMPAERRMPPYASVGPR